MATDPATEFPPLPKLHPLVLAAGLGAVWGGAAYAILWGLTPLAVSRRFVVGPVGTLVLLPVRIVLWGLRAAERVAGRSFHFPDSNWWIGVVAALVGAGLVVAVTAATRAVLRRRRS